jgi:hypothetical protein
VPIELSNSPNREYRMALDRACATARADGLNAIRRERFQVEYDEIAGLGYTRYVDAIAELSGIDLDALGRDADGFLADTADMYVECLARVVKRRLGIPLGDLDRADASWLFRADQYDAGFDGNKLLETARRQMREMELDPEQSGRVRFDTDEREGKQPRAFCVPVRVPEEVFLVLRPHGGHADYRTFWHELGHAMHFASPSRDLPFAARWLGDNSVTEGYAMLWDHVTLVPQWLERYTTLGRAEAANLAFELSVHELYMVRRYAAKLNYELNLHRRGGSGAAHEYVDRLTQATRFRYHEADHLADVDPGFYAARYLRAWQLEAVLANHLAGRFGDDWYRNPDAGALVQSLMAQGQAKPAHELAHQVTGVELGFGAITARLESTLG